MAIFIIVILAVTASILALRLFLLQQELRRATKELKTISGNGRMRIAAPDSSMEGLLAAINERLDLQQAESYAYQVKEHALRRQISNVSHDLRTPLTSILGYLQLLESATLTEEARSEYLQIVEGRAKTLQILITSFYDLSRLEGGEYPLEKIPVSLHQSLGTLLAECYNDFEVSGLEVEVDLAEKLPPVLADPNGVMRVFQNLVGNALKYSKRTLRVRLFETEHGQVTSFANDYSGLAPDDVPHIFERFYTADKMRTGQSTGLGLAIVKALCDQMGCSVKAELQDELFVISVLWKKTRNSYNG